MTLHFKESNYNWGDSFYILDENNQRKYRVKSSVLLWNRKFEILDLDKNVLVTIKKEPKSLIKKKFYIQIDGEQVAAITQEIPLMPKFTFEGLDWEMQGLMIYDYDMFSGGNQVLSFHQEDTPWGYRSVLRTNDPARDLLALAVVLTISYVIPARDTERSVNHL